VEEFIKSRHSRLVEKGGRYHSAADQLVEAGSLAIKGVDV